MENKLDINFYKTFYLDIYNLHLSDQSILLHFKNHGIYEKRFPSKEYFYKYYSNFNQSLYRICNKDIENFSEIDLIRHYHNYGIFEKRIGTIKDFYIENPDFDIDIYKKFNKDIINFDELSTIKHYIMFGKKECRIKNKSEIKNFKDLLFNYSTYKKFYPESNKMSNKEIKNEYLESKKKNIINHKIGSASDFYNIFPDFNIELYLTFNEKINDINESNNQDESDKFNNHDELDKSNNQDELNNQDESDKSNNQDKLDDDELIKNILLDEELNNFTKLNNEDEIEYDELDYNTDLEEEDILNDENDLDEQEKEEDEDNLNEVKEEDNDDLDEEDTKIDIMADFYKKYINNKKIIYSLKSFYENFPDFNYYDFINNYTSSLETISEIDSVIYFYKNKLQKFSSQNKNKFQNIIIYPHLNFNLSDGGVTVQFYLGKLLEELGYRVRIFKIWDIYEKNSIFNNYYNNDFDLNETLVIYSEAITGNPLNAKYVVRWLLSQLGKNVSKNKFYSWKKTDLVYYFNSQENFYEIENNYGLIYKNLSTIYINPIFKNNNNNRNGTCYTMRKSHYHKEITFFHPKDSIEITKNHTQDDYLSIFNNHKYFISYDPLTLLINIAPLCGCITIVHPLKNKTKLEWLKTTALWPFLEANNLDNLYGVAYGRDDLLYAIKTINLVSEQWAKDIPKYFREKSLIPFINDIQNFDIMENTVNNNFYNEINEYKNINLEYALEFNEDIKNLLDSKKYNEFLEKIMNEERIYNAETFYKKYNSFDVNKYKELNKELDESSDIEVMKHYIKSIAV